MDSKFFIEYKSQPSTLNLLAQKYHTDKGTPKYGSMHNGGWAHHKYTDFYERQFGIARNHVKNVFECGIGTNNVNILSNMSKEGTPGASLRMWRDYFPNAQVVGADIDPDVMFSEDRIETVLLDQTNVSAVSSMFSSLGRTFDVIIDDGLHTLEAASAFFSVAFDYLEPNGVYVIEDIRNYQVKDYREWADSTGVTYEDINFIPNINQTHLFVFRTL